MEMKTQNRPRQRWIISRFPRSEDFLSRIHGDPPSCTDMAPTWASGSEFERLFCCSRAMPDRSHLQGLKVFALDEKLGFGSGLKPNRTAVDCDEPSRSRGRRNRRHVHGEIASNVVTQGPISSRAS